MYEEDRIPAELDPAYDHLDEGPSRTMANRLRPVIVLGALIALIAIVSFIVF